MPNNALTSPLAAIVGRAAKSLPAQGAVAQRVQRAATGHGTVLLCDVSSSMLEIARGAQRKIDLLRDALRHIDTGHHTLAFASDCRECGTLPEPGGTTAMHLAIAHAASIKPALTVLLTDGHPDNADTTLAAAATLTGHLRIVYLGPETDTDALDFLRRLAARAAAGWVTASPLATQPLLPTLQRALTAGRP